MEKNYFVTDLLESKVKIISDHKIEFCEFTIKEETGIILDERNFHLALATLSAAIASQEKSKIYEGIIKIVLRLDTTPKDPKQKVFVRSWEGKNENIFIQITNDMLSPYLKNTKDIQIYVPHGQTSPLISNDSFNIHIWSSPIHPNRGTLPPKKIFNIPVDCQDIGYAPSGQGISISDPDTGYAMAELIGNNLYIHYDICHTGSTNEQKIYRQILEKTIQLIPLSSQELVSYKIEQEKYVLNNLRRKYISICSQRADNTVTELEKKVSSGQSKIKQLESELTNLIRHTTDQERQLILLKNDSDLLNQKYTLEFDKLLALPQIEKIEIDPSKLVLHTYIICCLDPDTRYLKEIGAFEIRIYTQPTSENYIVIWKNKSRLVEIPSCGKEMNAPHVFNDGHACLGNLHGIFPPLIANQEYSVAAMLSIQFIEHVNTDDSAGKYIDYWPNAKEKDIIRYEKIFGHKIRRS